MEDQITLIRRNELMEGRTKLGLMMMEVVEELLVGPGLHMIVVGLDKSPSIALGPALGPHIALKVHLEPLQIVWLMGMGRVVQPAAAVVHNQTQQDGKLKLMPERKPCTPMCAQDGKLIFQQLQKSQKKLILQRQQLLIHQQLG